MLLLWIEYYIINILFTVGQVLNAQLKIVSGPITSQIVILMIAIGHATPSTIAKGVACAVS